MREERNERRREERERHKCERRSGIRDEYRVNIQKGGAGSERDCVHNIRMEEGMNGK